MNLASELAPLQLGEDIADQIMFALTRPGRVQVCDMLVYPTSQASSQHIARE